MLKPEKVELSKTEFKALNERIAKSDLLDDDKILLECELRANF